VSLTLVRNSLLVPLLLTQVSGDFAVLEYFTSMNDTRWGIPYRCQWHRQRGLYCTSVNDTSNANDIAKFWLSSVNMSDRTYQIANISYTKPTRFHNCQIPNLKDTKPIRCGTIRHQAVSHSPCLSWNGHQILPPPLPVCSVAKLATEQVSSSSLSSSHLTPPPSLIWPSTPLSILWGEFCFVYIRVPPAPPRR
jgi:hypothetical protein